MHRQQPVSNAFRRCPVHRVVIIRIIIVRIIIVRIIRGFIRAGKCC